MSESGHDDFVNGLLGRVGFEAHDVEGWREHYARTCRLWTERLAARRAEAEAEVGPAKTRLWLLYLAGCALAFERGGALISQELASKRARTKRAATEAGRSGSISARRLDVSRSFVR